MAEFAAAASHLAGAAAVLLGWQPEEFWRATPAELAAVLRAMTGGAHEPLQQAEITRLMEMFPDG